MTRAVHGMGASRARALGGIACDVLDAWFDPTPAAIAAAAASASSLRESPDIDGVGLIEAIAAHTGVDPGLISLGGGSSEIIRRVLPPLVGTGRAIILDPGYSEYLAVLARSGAEIKRFELSADASFRPDLNQLARECDTADWLILVNPNNPTGTCLRAQEIVALAERNPALRIWVDEAYVDFAPPGTSVAAEVKGSEQIFVLKSLSKAYALSGARVAYLLSPKSVAMQNTCDVPPWIISNQSISAAIAALSDSKYYDAQWNQTQLRLQTFAAQLMSMGLLIHCGVIPAVLIRTAKGASLWAQALADLGIFVRVPRGMGEVLGDDWVRVALPRPEEEERVVVALRTVAAKLIPD